ncbi:fluoride efflux transporter CrcB [Streptomyces sp. LaBMicrA B280]|uniref:fluoride efflux transporter CrcB n=1 Tax=Streptomyces sp. LaBMicrA B280 TaxID=3391001 RepID=UPI003BA599D6
MTTPEADTLRARRTPRRRTRWRAQGPVVAVVAVGGALGACGRYGLGLAWPAAPDSFPWATFWINVIGCAVMGVFMVFITEVWAAHRLVRPFFGTGVLGGFTTFSTYAVDIRRLVEAGRPGVGLVYLVATPCAALTAVWLASTIGRRMLTWRERA